MKEGEYVRKNMCVPLNVDLYHKLNMICMIKKYTFKDKSASMTNMINQALYEYFDNHKTEIDNLINEYHKNGGCANIGDDK